MSMFISMDGLAWHLSEASVKGGGWESLSTSSRKIILYPSCNLQNLIPGTIIASKWIYLLWQYELWSFQMEGTKLELKTILNFENWVNGKVSKVPKFDFKSQFYISKIIRIFFIFFHWRISIQKHIFCYWHFLITSISKPLYY